jgi:hypothetical protein
MLRGAMTGRRMGRGLLVLCAPRLRARDNILGERRWKMEGAIGGREIWIVECWINVSLTSTACGGIRPMETADGGTLRLPTEEQYLIYKQSLPVGSLDERQDSTYNDNAFTWPVLTWSSICIQSLLENLSTT